jgi:23S rRNA pseudouridine1911/1915/1917 synthase
MPEHVNQHAIVGERQHGMRLDQAAAELFPDFSRARLQAWIRDGALLADGACLRPRDKVSAGVELIIDARLDDEVGWKAQSIALDIVHDDAEIIVVNKPPGLVVHPAAGHREGTLVNALLHAYPELSALPRAGVVHRLDKETSGLMVVARSLRAHADLVEQLQARAVKREYAAICVGRLTGGGTVDAPIGRHPRARKKMAVVASGGKTAITHYRLEERFAHHTLVAVTLETGRTHQIRVHMAHLHHPLVGDPQYGGRPRLPAGAAQPLVDALRRFPRQALHARRLGLRHPADGNECEWEVPLPQDMQALLACLREFDREAGS